MSACLQTYIYACATFVHGPYLLKQKQQWLLKTHAMASHAPDLR